MVSGKYFENALDQAGIDHDMKMVIEGHIAGTRARHYTELDVDQLRELYRKAYPFIDPDSEDAVENRIGSGSWRREVLEQTAKQQILEAKLASVKDELDRLRESIGRLEKLDLGSKLPLL